MKKLLLLFLLVPFIGSSQTTKPMYAYNVYMGNLDSAKIFGSNNNITYNFWGIDLIKKAVKYTDSAFMLSGYARSGISYSKAQSDARYQLAGSYLISSDLSPYLLASTAASTYATVAQNALKINITDSASMLAAYTRTGVAFTKAQSDARYLQSFTELDPKRVTTAAFAGSTTKTLTLTLADASTVTASFNDNNTGGSNTVSLPITLTGADIGADTTTSTTGLATKGYALNLANGKASIAQLNTDTTAVGNRLTSVINATNATVATNTTALSGKQATLPTGTTSQYYRGDLSLATFPAIPAAIDTTPLGTRLTSVINTTNTTVATHTTQIAGKQSTLTTGTTSQYFRGDLSLATFPAIPAAVDTSGLGARVTANTNATNATVATNTTAIAGKEPTITPGTTGQYWRGDKTWQTLPTAGSGQTQVFDYTISKISTIYYAYDRTGATSFSGSNAATVINSAIYSLSNGGTIGFTQAIYNLSYPIIDTGRSNINLVFAKGAKLLAGNNLDKPVIYLTSVSHWRIYNPEIDGNAVNQTAPQVSGAPSIIPDGVGASTCTDCILYDANIHNVRRFGANFDESSTSSGIINSYITTCGWNGINLGNHTTDLDLFALNNDISACGDVGIAMYGVGCRTTGNSIHDIIGTTGSNNQGYAITIEGGGNNLIADNRLSNLKGAGIFGINAFENNKITGNKIDQWDSGQTSAPAIHLYSEYNLISDNILNSTRTIAMGVKLESATNNTVSNNYINAKRPIWLQTSANNNFIFGNTCKSVPAPIHIEDNTCTSNKIDYNDLTASSASIEDAGTSTIIGFNYYSGGSLHVPAVALTTGTTVITQSANNNSTAPASTAYADAIGTLKLSKTDFIIGETPTGTINGTNTVFVLANTPVTGKEVIYVDGRRQKRGTDYTISGATYTMTIAPPTGSILIEDYLK